MQGAGQALSRGGIPDRVEKETHHRSACHDGGHGLVVPIPPPGACAGSPRGDKITEQLGEDITTEQRHTAFACFPTPGVAW